MIGVLALALRLWFALTIGADRPLGGVDADRYEDIAASLADGEGYSWHPGRSVWTPGDRSIVEADAQHPPLHPVLLASADVAGFHSSNAHRAVASVVAALGVVVTGLAGRKLFSPRAGLIAAGLAAVHPLWFQHPGYMISEATFMLVVPLALLVAATALERPQLRWFALTGVAIGLCALTRTEAIVLAPLLGVPLALTRGTGHRLRAIAVFALGVLVVVGPWVARNDRTFGTPAISYNGGATLAGANCDETYDGPRLGGFGNCARYVVAVIRRWTPVEPRPATMDRVLREHAEEYARDHLSRLPVVALARVGRTAGVYRLGDTVRFDEGIGADRRFQWAGITLHLVLAPVALVGLATLWRSGRRRPLVVLLAGPALAVVTGVSVYGATRMRVAAEPAIVLLAAVALDMAWRKRGGAVAQGARAAALSAA